MAAGLSNVRIAHRLGISRSSVKRHLEKATVKLGARTRAHAVALAHDLGVLGDVSTAPAPPHASPTEEDCALLRRVASGARLGEIARELHVSRRTVDRRLAAARSALAAATTAAAVAAAKRRGLI